MLILFANSLKSLTRNSSWFTVLYDHTVHNPKQNQDIRPWWRGL